MLCPHFVFQQRLVIANNTSRTNTDNCSCASNVLLSSLEDTSVYDTEQARKPDMGYDTVLPLLLPNNNVAKFPLSATGLSLHQVWHCIQVLLELMSSL